MKIAFVHSGKAYLPEIKAYVRYLNEQEGYLAQELPPDAGVEGFEVVWRFPGLDLKGVSKDQLLVHEYNSLSVGRFHTQKDQLKKLLNTTPQGRVFLNQAVKAKYNFRDDVPSLLRDMGIAEAFFQQPEQKAFDFVYLGSMAASRCINRFLEHLSTHFNGYKVLLIGEPDPELYRRYGHYKNFTFTGRLAYEQVPEVAAQAIYGLNLVPDVFPLNIQTSTKLLEYCALGLHIVSTDYGWAREFAHNTNGSFFFLDPQLSNFNPASLEAFHFETPDVTAYAWENILKEAGLVAFLEALRAQ